MKPQASLLLDAIAGDLAENFSSCFPFELRGMVRAKHVPFTKDFDAIFLVDHGTMECVGALREAIAYRKLNPGCTITVIRRVSADCGETEALLRSLAPRVDDQGLSVPANALRPLLGTQNNFEVLISDDAVLFEYAA